MKLLCKTHPECRLKRRLVQGSGTEREERSKLIVNSCLNVSRRSYLVTPPSQLKLEITYMFRDVI